MKKNIVLSVAAVVGTCAFAAAPQVQNVQTRQDPSSRIVTITYSLASAPGIVTPSVQTNRGDGVWIDIGDANLTHFTGDVNMEVDVGDHVITWRPDKAWPNQKITDKSVRIGVKAWALDAPPDYMVVSLVINNYVRYYTGPDALPEGGVQADIYKTDYMVFRKIPAAGVTWRYGSPSLELGRQWYEPCRVVSLSHDYYMAVYPCTQKQYWNIMFLRPSYFNNEDDWQTRPVDSVSVSHIRGFDQVTGAIYKWPFDGHNVYPNCDPNYPSFMQGLRSRAGVDRFEFDLPSCAQWEYACRAGCGNALYNGHDMEDGTTSQYLNELGRYAGNGGFINGTEVPPQNCTAEHGTAKVGSYAPNAWGLYDMLGNVLEWCLNVFNDDPRVADIETTLAEGDQRCIRGGCWSSPASVCRAAQFEGCDRWYANQNIGFRVCLDLIPQN